MDNMSELSKLKLLTGEGDTNLLSLLLNDAKEFVLVETNRTSIPKELESLPRRIALIAYNRMGTEGEKARSEAGESYTFDDLPESIQRLIRSKRIARCGGHAHEKKPDGNVLS